MTSIYHLSWSKTSFISKLLLFFKSRHHEYKRIRGGNSFWVQAQGYSALSSAYYTIAGTAQKQTQTLFQPLWLLPLFPIRLLAWGLLGGWCSWHMLSLSNKVVELIGYEGMNTDQCDVRQSILRRKKRYWEATKCLLAGIEKKSDKAHTRAFFCIGLADIYLHDGFSHKAREQLELAIREAAQAEKEDLRQAARVYRHCANLTDRINKSDPVSGNRLREKAKLLIEEVGASDQLLKMQ